jgi:hypothetical protein
VISFLFFCLSRIHPTCNSPVETSDVFSANCQIEGNHNFGRIRIKKENKKETKLVNERRRRKEKLENESLEELITRRTKATLYMREFRQRASEEKKELWKLRDRMRKEEKFQNLPVEVKEQLRIDQRDAQRARRAKIAPQDEDIQAKPKKTAEESLELQQQRRERAKFYMRQVREQATEEQKEYWRLQDRHRKMEQYWNLPDEIREQKKVEHREDQRVRRFFETPEQKAIRQEKDRERKRLSRSCQTSEKKGKFDTN